MRSPCGPVLWTCCGIGVLAASVAVTAQPRSASRLGGLRDFDGVWDVVTLTPFERPAEFANKRFLTRDEADEYAKRKAAEISFERRAETPEADLQQPSINEFWAERGPLMMVDGRYPTAQISDPPNGRLPAYTPAAQARWNAQLAARRQASQASDYTTSERCLLQLPLPALRSSSDGSLVRITQTDTHIVIAQEKTAPRVVPIDSPGHLGSGVTMWSGDSQAEWKGNTLVIDTTNFTPRLEEAFGLWPLDRNLHVVERMRRIDGGTLYYEYTVEDPTVFTTRWTAILILHKSRGELYEVACHEGNYALRNMLAGARASERLRD